MSSGNLAVLSREGVYCHLPTLLANRFARIRANHLAALVFVPSSQDFTNLLTIFNSLLVVYLWFVQGDVLVTRASFSWGT